VNRFTRFWDGFKHGRQRQREINRARQQSTASSVPKSESEEAQDYFPRVSRVEDLIWAYKYKAFQLTEEELGRYVSEGIISSEDWEELKSFSDREKREVRLGKTKRALEDAVRNDVISSFVHHNFKNGSVAIAGDALKPEIITLLHEGKEEELEIYLNDVLRSGLEGARRNKEKTWRHSWVGKGGWEFGGGYWGLLWETLNGLFSVALVSGVLLAAHSRFETIVFALLLLILNGVWDRSSSAAALLIGFAALLHVEFMRVRKLLNDEPPAEVRESDVRDDREIQKMQKRVMLRGYIRGAFAFIAWVIIIVNILSAVL
jgi:hypothetical protein